MSARFRPRAAPAHFPYHGHRTLAEVWAGTAAECARCGNPLASAVHHFGCKDNAATIAAQEKGQP